MGASSTGGSSHGFYGSVVTSDDVPIGARPKGRKSEAQGPKAGWSSWGGQRTPFPTCIGLGSAVSFASGAGSSPGRQTVFPHLSTQYILSWHFSGVSRFASGRFVFENW